MRVLVTFAVDAEFAPWRNLRQFHKTKPFLSSFMSRSGQTEITVLLTGMGCKNKWAEAAEVLFNSKVDICISTGLAGALRSEHAIGEILVPESILASQSNHDIPCDRELVELAVDVGAKKVGRFYTADRVIVEAKRKKELGSIADAVDMESGEILLKAAAVSTRAVAIRAISDASDENLPLDFNKASSEKGDVIIRKIVGQALMSPGSIPSLMRFGKQSKLAAIGLAEFLERFAQRLAVPTHMLGALK